METRIRAYTLPPRPEAPTWMAALHVYDGVYGRGARRGAPRADSGPERPAASASVPAAGRSVRSGDPLDRGAAFRRVS